MTPGDAPNIGGRPITGVVGPERLREIDDLDRSGIELGHELGQDGHKCRAWGLGLRAGECTKMTGKMITIL